MRKRQMPCVRTASVLVLVLGCCIQSMVVPQAAVSSADVGIAPAPPSIVGPLQRNPPPYPAVIGVPLIPPARSGVTASADVLNPITPHLMIKKSPRNIAGVSISADAVNLDDA